MANSQEIIRYKQQIINAVLNDYELVKLIDSQYADDTDESTIDAENLLYNNVFPYYYNPELVTEQKCFLFMMVDTPRVQSDLIKDMQITIIVASHQGLMKVPYDTSGTRIDLMSACVDRLFNGKGKMGFGDLSLSSNIEGSIDTRHRCRTIRFKVEDFNLTKCD